MAVKPGVEQILINRTQLAHMMGCSRNKTYRLQYLDDDFPEPKRDACGTQMWRRDEVLSYIDDLWARADGKKQAQS